VARLAARRPTARSSRRWQKLLDDGLCGSIAEIADKERINRSYLSRTIRLSLLAPDIVEAILNGTQPAACRPEGPFSIDWQEQRAVRFRRKGIPVAVHQIQTCPRP
jgi:hypothetical protein